MNYYQNPDYLEAIEDMNRLDDKAVHSMIKLFRHTLLVSSSMYAILISLHATPVQDPHIRRVYIAAIILLAAGILFQLAALFDLSMMDERRRKHLLSKEIPRVARGEKYDPSRIFVGNRRLSQILRLCSILLFVLSVLDLSYYTVLITGF
jgi:hypothetical protein